MNIERTAEIICDMAQRSFQSERPLLLLVVYDHEGDKLRLIDSLHSDFERFGIQGRSFNPSRYPEHGIGKFYGAITPRGDAGFIALVTDLPVTRTADTSQLDREFLQYLNLQRDWIATDRLRMVLFIHESHVEQLMLTAADFWDFRHKTLWLERPETLLHKEFVRKLKGGEPGEALESRELNERVERHVNDVRELLERTEDRGDRAALFLDLARWLGRRNLFRQAAQVAREGIVLAQGESGTLLAELKCGTEMAFTLNREREAFNMFLQAYILAKQIDSPESQRVLEDICQVAGNNRKLWRVWLADLVKEDDFRAGIENFILERLAESDL